MQDVALLAGVSVKTVSNVLADHPHVRPDKRERVFAAVQELNYRINVSARNLRSGKTRVIGLAVPDLSQAYFGELSDAVIRAARSRGYTVLIEQTSADRKTEIETIERMREHLIDGLIFSPLALGPEDAGYLHVDFPLVVLGERILHSPADHITMANTVSARVATEHLLSLGKRRIAVIGAHPHDPVGTAALRLQGYAEALEVAGIQVEPELILAAPLWRRADGAEAATRLLRSGVEIDAIFCFNDALALGALRVLLAHGRRVPEDIALVGFDDIEDARYSTPTLTTVSPGREQIAKTAVDMLVDRIEDNSIEAKTAEIEVGSTLVVRESTLGTSGN